MNQRRFNEIAAMIFKRLEDHEKENTVCILPINDRHLDTTRCIPILKEVADVFGVDVGELNDVLGEMIDTNTLFIVPNRSGKWGTIIYSKRL